MKPFENIPIPSNDESELKLEYSAPEVVEYGLVTRLTEG
jgi:hypothetical protein